MGKKKLRNKEWEEIHQLLIDDDLSIQDIANKYSVNRLTIYQKAWKMGWISKKVKVKEEPKKEGIINKIGDFFGK